MKNVDPKYRNISRASVSTSILKIVQSSKTDLKERLSKIDNVAVTLDIWSDRQMRGFLGVTVHYISDSGLQTKLLVCERFTGRHTGVRIAEHFETVVDEYGLDGKVTYLVTDNASNMKRAFATAFPETFDDGVDDDGIWEDVGVDELQGILPSHERLSCFAHSLQLVVGEGLKAVKNINPVMGKVSRLTTMLHTSVAFKEAFEVFYGPNRGVPQPNATRWNSTLRQVRAVLALGWNKINNLLDDQDKSHIKFTAREWSQLKELNYVLSPFLEATDITQGDKAVTISSIVPTVLSLAQCLQQLHTTHLTALRVQLLDSLRTRFSGIFAQMEVIPQVQPVIDLPFGSSIYVLSSVLDPSYYLMWVDEYLEGSAEYRDQVRAKLRTNMMAALRALPRRVPRLIQGAPVDAPGAPVVQPEVVAADGDNRDIDDEYEPPPKLFAGLHRQAAREVVPTSAERQYQKYLDLCETRDKVTDSLTFWRDHQKLLPDLYKLAMHLFTVPATSAPVERVFSHGGIIMRPHRARLGDTMLSHLIFLKCNLLR